MGVRFIAHTEGATFTTTTPNNTNHDGGTAPRGVLATVAMDGAATDTVSSVTYGGVTMRRIAFSVDSATELGAVWMYWLGEGSNIPTGTQTLAVNHGGTAQVKIASITTYDSDEGWPQLAISNVTLIQDGLVASNIVNVGGIGGEVMGQLVYWSDNNTPLVAGGGNTIMSDHDYGTQVSGVWRTTALREGYNRFTVAATAGDGCLAAAGIVEYGYPYTWNFPYPEWDPAGEMTPPVTVSQFIPIFTSLGAGV